LSNPCKISIGLGLHHLHQDFSFRLCPLGLESAAGLSTTKIFPVRSLGFGAEFSLHRTRSGLPPKPSVSYSWVVSRPSFLCSQFGCQCCLYLSCYLCQSFLQGGFYLFVGLQFCTWCRSSVPAGFSIPAPPLARNLLSSFHYH
jgi:hypothetical protein